MSDHDDAHEAYVASRSTVHVHPICARKIKVEKRDGSIENIDSAQLMFALVRQEGLVAQYAIESQRLPKSRACKGCGKPFVDRKSRRATSQSHCLECIGAALRAVCPCGNQLGGSGAIRKRANDPQRQWRCLRCEKAAQRQRRPTRKDMEICSCGRPVAAARTGRCKVCSARPRAPDRKCACGQTISRQSRTGMCQRCYSQSEAPALAAAAGRAAMMDPALRDRAVAAGRARWRRP